MTRAPAAILCLLALLASKPRATSGAGTAATTGTDPPRATLPAFPGAQGGGAMASGGRGRCGTTTCDGRAIAVTTLADSGPGSLRACVDARGARTCVFRVAGEIALTSPLAIASGNSEITIAGQTAPGGGITITGKGLAKTRYAMLYLSNGAHDVVLRYVRLRRLLDRRCASGGGASDCEGIVHVYGPVRDILIDHVSVSWSIDDSVFNTVGTGATRNVTWSWNLVAESFRAGGDTQNTAGIIYGSSPADASAMTDLDLHHNVITNVDHRLPVWAAGRFRHVSNIMHPFGDRCTWIGGGSNAEIIDNLWKPGPGTSSAEIAELIIIVPERPYHNYPDLNAGAPRLFLLGNRGPHATPDEWWLTHATTDLNGWGPRGRGDLTYVHPAPARYKGPRLPALEAPISEDAPGEDGSALEELLWVTGSSGYGPAGASRRVDCTGRWVDARDLFDQGAYTRYRDGTGFEPSSEEDPRYAVTRSRWSDVKAAIAAGSPCTDSDGDGIPDAYEDVHGLARNDPSDAQRRARDGYTWLEHYLNGQ